MQHMHTHKAVNGCVEAKKVTLLSDYNIFYGFYGLNLLYQIWQRKIHLDFPLPAPIHLRCSQSLTHYMPKQLIKLAQMKKKRREKMLNQRKIYNVVACIGWQYKYIYAMPVASNAWPDRNFWAMFEKAISTTMSLLIQCVKSILMHSDMKISPKFENDNLYLHNLFIFNSILQVTCISYINK